MGPLATPFAFTRSRKEGTLVTEMTTFAPLILAITPLFLDLGQYQIQVLGDKH